MDCLGSYHGAVGSPMSRGHSVQLAAWGSHENSGAPEELSTCLPSRAPSDNPDGTQRISSRPTDSILQAGHKPLQDLQLSLTATEDDQAAAQHPRALAGGHRSMPGVPDLHPQEVIVKVQVTQRSNADAGGKFSQGPAHAKAQHSSQQQQQAPLAKARTTQQDSNAAGTITLCAELQAFPSQDIAHHPGSAHSSINGMAYPSSVSSASPRRPAQKQLMVPLLDLSKAQLGKGPPIDQTTSDLQPVSHRQAERDAELCLDLSSRRAVKLHPNAPMQDNRCYHFKATGTKEVAAVQALLARLSPEDAAQVQSIWDQLLVARKDCEALAARGVRISRDISRDWQETVSDLIDRVVAQDGELAQLKQQLKAAQQQAAAAASAAAATASTGGAAAPGSNGSQYGSRPSSAAGSNMEDLHSQVVRLKRHRDKLMRDQQELSRELAETRLQLLQGTQHKAAETQDQLAFFHQQAQDLRDQHVSLLQQHIELAAYAEGLEAATVSMQQHHTGYVLAGCAHPMAIAPAMLAPAAYAAGQNMGWVLHSGASQELCAGLQEAGRSSSVPIMVRPGLPHHAQPAWGAIKAGRMHGPHGVIDPHLVMKSAGGTASNSAAAPTTPATTLAVGDAQAEAAAGSEGAAHSTSSGVAPVAAATTTGWRSSLAGLVHVGRSHNSKRAHQRVARLGPSPVKGTHTAGDSRPVTLAESAAAGSMRASGPASVGLPAEVSAVASLSGAGNPSAALAGLVDAAQGAEDAAMIDALQRYNSAIVRSTIEQAAAVVTAAGPGGSLGPSRRVAASCPGKAVLSQQRHQAGAGHAAVAAAAGLHASHLAAAVSVDIPQHRSTDHTPRARAHDAHGKTPCVPGPLSNVTFSAATSQSLGSLRDDHDADAVDIATLS